jgi:cephalosporin hydroxylase
VISIDLEPRAQPPHPRITYLTGSSTADDVVAQVAARARGRRTVLVLLDSDHARDHVLAELRRYAPLVTRGSFVVVEDTNLNGHPVDPDFGPGPMEAVDAFLAETDAFEVDRTKDKLYLSFNPRGYLKRVR